MGRKSESKNGSNLRPAFYFGILVFFIIAVSIFFKVFDTLKKSKFDGNNRFTVAVVSKNKVDLLTVSPKDGTLSKVSVGKISEDDFKYSSLPREDRKSVV